MPDLIGTTLGPYRLIEQIGLGGMATIYKAYHAAMDRLVAVKVLPQHFARDPNFVQRFYQEARLIAKLEHRNILPVYDFGESDGTAYLVMRYLQAGTVKDILSRGPLPLDEAARLLADVAAALDYAHALNIIHRDVKPSNVLVDTQGNAYLTDFGLARVLESASELTGSAAVGTPAYMAPEQALGKPVTPQTDVYSLGVMLYEMVTGKPPFDAVTPMAIALMHVHEPLPLPRAFRPELPEAAELVILKAVAKDPEDRYQTAGDVARAFSGTTGLAKVAVSGQSRLGDPKEAAEAVALHSHPEIKPAVTEAKPFSHPRQVRWWPVAGLSLGGFLIPIGGGVFSTLAPSSGIFDPVYSPLSALILVASVTALLLVALSVWALRVRSPSPTAAPARAHNGKAVAAIVCGAGALLFAPLPLLGPPRIYFDGPAWFLPALATPLSVLLAGWAWWDERRSASEWGEVETTLGLGSGGVAAAALIGVGMIFAINR